MATDLTLSKLKREFLKRGFKFSGAMLWNQISNEAKLTKSISLLILGSLLDHGWVLPTRVS